MIKKWNQFNEENIFKRFFNGSNENLVSKACKDLGLVYRKNDDGHFHIAGKNGHEISVKFIESQIEDSINNVTPPLEKTAIIVRPSYYGTFYEAEKEVSDLKEYLSNYDFNFKPDILHKYNYDFKSRSNENLNQYNVIKLDDYFSDPNAEECPVLDILMKYQVEKVPGEIETSDDPWITKKENENIWELNYEFYITDSDIGKWFKKVTKGKYPGQEYRIELKLPLKEFDILIYLYKSKKIDDSEFIKRVGDLSSKSGEKYGIKLTDLKSTQMNYIRKANPEALKEIGLYNMKNFELDNTSLNDIEWSSKNETFVMKYLKKFNENNTDLPFRSKLLHRESNIGKYELYVDGHTGWGIIFPNGYIEVEEGPHESVGNMRGEINGTSVEARGYDVPRIPSKYWMGEMSNDELSTLFDSFIDRYSNITKEPFRYKM